MMSRHSRILTTLWPMVCWILVFFISAPPVFSQIQKQEEDIDRNDLLNAVRAGRPQNVDTRAAIVNLLKDVKEANITPEDFYQKVSELEMPPGKELRHVLMEVKKDVGNYLGEEGLRSVFGEIYESGATRVEAVILSHRKAIVMETIKKAIVIYRDKVKAKTGELPGNSFYYGEVGGWPNESFKELKFAGDIDFNFLSGDLEGAMELKDIFDKLIKEQYNGRTPEEIDIPCTVHGMATAEVYVGKHGQSFAEEVTKVVWEIDFDDAGPNTDLKADPVQFELALQQMVVEAKVDEVNRALPDLKTENWPYQPGISLEMIRHFEHDIAGKDVFTNLESFVKGAKYADRAYKFLIKELGEDATFDPWLKKFVEKLTKWKKDPKAQVAFIKLYFEKIGSPLPFEVDLEINQSGKSRATLKANQEKIEEFWDHCRQAMWDGANQVLRKKTADLKRRVDALGKDDIEESKKIYEELVKLDEMLEVEYKVNHDEVAGLHGKVDPEYEKLMGQFRDMRGDFKQKTAKFGHIEYIDPKLGKTYQWIETMLKIGKPDSIKMAAATMLSAPGKFNDVLDFLDDGLMTKLRQGEGADYIKLLRKGQGLYWDERANIYLRKIGQEGRFDTQFQAMEAKYGEAINGIEKLLNSGYEKILSNRGLKVVQKVNTTFNESVSSSKTGQKLMTGMMLYNLKDELPVYWNLLMKDDYETLAAEFFKRRVPFGGAVERYVMGDYYGVGWEVTSTMIPPAAIASAAFGVGQSVALSGIEAHIGEELETFIDNLYDGAEFKIGSIEKVGEDIKVSHWQLLSVSYQGKTFKYDELMEMETADAREMGGCLKQPTKERPSCFPMEKMSNGVFEWWRNRDAFEDAFKKTDPWIQLIVEMKAHPNVGSKLEEHFRYQLYTRLEQIKVKFLHELRSKLEDRKAGEVALISGQFLKMYEELFNVAEALDITLQVQETIDEKFGGGVVQFLTWMKDYLRGVVRELKGDVDVWDVYEELAAHVTKSLKVYKAVREARVKAEALLGDRTEDQGLRLLTGPYFLDGESSFDQKASTKLAKYPFIAQKTMTQKMQTVKKETDADPSTLDTSEGSYDASILEQLTFHETFSELWIHVNSRFLVAKVPSYLGANGAKQSKPNPEGGSDDSDLAVKRFKLHQQRVEDILEEYRNHYKNQKKEEDKDGENKGEDETSGEEQGGPEEDGDQESEGQTAGLLAQMKALAEQMTALRAQTTASLAEFKTKTQAVEGAITTFDEMYGHISKALKQLIKESNNPVAGSPEDVLNRLRKDGEELARLRDQIERHTLSICEAYATMKANPPLNEADRILLTAKNRNSRVGASHRTATSIVNRMKTTKSQADKMGMSSSKDDEIYRLISEGERLLGEKEKIKHMLREAGGAMQIVEAAPSQATGIVSQGESIRAQADGITGSELRGSDQAAIQEINGMYHTLTTDAGLIDKGPKEINAIGVTVFFKMGEVDASVKSLTKLMDEARVLAAKEGSSGRDWASEIDAQYEAGMLFWDPIAQAKTNAGICMSGVVSQHKVVASPSGQVAALDCSQFGNAEAYWDSRNRVARCGCKAGYRPTSSGKRCMKDVPKEPAYDPYEEPAYDRDDRGGYQKEPSFTEEMLERAQELGRENDRRRQEQRQQRRQQQRGLGLGGIFKDEGSGSSSGGSGSSGGSRNPSGGFGSGESCHWDGGSRIFGVPGYELSVVCKCNGKIVADSRCPGPKPKPNY